MLVYVLHRDVVNEFGDVLGVYSSEDKAETARAQALLDDEAYDYELTVEVWEVL